jgi:hypothetical protein
VNDSARYLEILAKLLSFCLPKQSDISLTENTPELKIVLATQEEKDEIDSLLAQLGESPP